MELQIKIDLENDAFQEDFGGEIIKVLQRLSTNLSNYILPPDKLTLKDSNGNTVGFAEFK